MASRLQTTMRAVHNTFKEKRMSEENSTGSNLIWAVTLIIIVAIMAGALYYSGFLSGNKKQEVDVDIKVPAAANR